MSHHIPAEGDWTCSVFLIPDHFRYNNQLVKTKFSVNTVKISIENQNQLLGSKGGGVTVHSAVQTSQHTVAEKSLEFIIESMHANQ